MPADGLGVAYDFDTTTAGDHAVARIGYEFARAPFRWRVDYGEWHAVEPDTYTTDLMAIADFAEVAWIELGEFDLKPGKHTVEFHVLPRTKSVDGKAVPERLLFGLDAVCVAPNEFGRTGHTGRGRPGKSGRDKSAARVTLRLPRGADLTPRRPTGAH